MMRRLARLFRFGLGQAPRSTDVLAALGAEPRQPDQHVVLIIDVVGYSQKLDSQQCECFTRLRGDLEQQLAAHPLLAQTGIVLCTGDGFVVVGHGPQTALGLLDVAVKLLQTAVGIDDPGYQLTCGMALGRGSCVQSCYGSQFLGDAVNMAARVQSLALPGQLLITTTLYQSELQRNSAFSAMGVEAEGVGELPVKHDERIGCHTVSGQGIGVTRQQDANRRLDTKPGSLAPDLPLLSIPMSEQSAQLADAVTALYQVVIRAHGPADAVGPLLKAELESVLHACDRGARLGNREDIDLGRLQAQLADEGVDALFLDAVRAMVAQLQADAARQVDDDERD